MSVEETTDARKANRVEPHSNMEMIVNGKVYKVPVGTICGKEVYSCTDAWLPAWMKKRNVLSQWFNKNLERIALDDRYYLGNYGMLAVEAHVLMNFTETEMMKPVPCVNIDKNNIKQVQENFTKIVEGNRDMIKPIRPSAAPQTYRAAGGSSSSSSSSSTMGAAGGSSNGKEPMAMEIEPDAFEGLSLAPKDRYVPYECSSYCQENFFYNKGGCPTCNVYWKKGMFRDNRVATRKWKGNDVVVKTSTIEGDFIAKHYAEVKRKNPTWKLEGDIPTPPDILEVQSLDKKQKAKRKLEWDEENEKNQVDDDTKEYPRVPPTSYTVLCPTYQCSDVCMTGKFIEQGCPTCSEFWKAIDARYPGRPTTRTGVGGFELRNKNNLNYETYKWDVPPTYDLRDFQSHFIELLLRFPDWQKNEKGEPQIPKELLTKNKDAALMLTKAPYYPRGTLEAYDSRFSWQDISNAKSSFHSRKVLAFWPTAKGWFPAIILGLCDAKRKYHVVFYPFDFHEIEKWWIPLENIKLVDWAPSHSPGTKRNPSLVGKKVMAQDFGVGWMPGIIIQPPDPPKEKSTLPEGTVDAESEEESEVETCPLPYRVRDIAKEHKKYYVVFDEPDQKPGDPVSSNPAYHYSLHPYQFCVLLDETLPVPKGLPHVIDTIDESDRNGNVQVMAWDDSVWCPGGDDWQWRLGWAKGVDSDGVHMSVVLQGECEMLKIQYEDCIPIESAPKISHDTPFDRSLVKRDGFVIHANNDGLEGWTRCKVTGFINYKYRVKITDARELYSKVLGNFYNVDSSKLWLIAIDPLAPDATMNEVQTDATATDAVQDLVGSAEKIDLNQK